MGGGHVLLKWEGIDVPPIMHAWKRGSADTSSCSQSHAPTRLYPQLMARQQLMTLHSGLGPISLARPTLYKWRQNVFIVQRVTRQPADGGLPWPRWTSGASFRNRRSLAWWLTATRAGFTTLSLLRYFAACVRLCVFVFQILTHHCKVFMKPKKAWLSSWMNVRMIIVEKDLCACYVGFQLLLLQPVSFHGKWCLYV